jgi:hypothetical protein
MAERKREVRKERGVEYQDRLSARCPGGASRAQCRASSAAGQRDTCIALDDRATDAITNFARLLARCGYSREDALRQFRTELHRLPPHLGRDERDQQATAHDAANLMSWWYTHADCLNSRGRPIPLRLQGPAPSLEALAREVGSTLAVTDLRDYLTFTLTIRARGDRYIPIKRYVVHRPQSRTLSAHALRIVAGLLRTAERNTNVERNTGFARDDHRVPFWLEAAADGEVSANHTIATMRYLEPAAMKLLEHADDSMARQGTSRSDRDRMVPLSMVVYMFEELREANSGKPGHSDSGRASTPLTHRPRPLRQGPASTSRKRIKAQRKAKSPSAG